MKILIVEDEQHIADGLRFNLEADGYEAEIAHDGETALDMLKSTNFDAIVANTNAAFELNGKTIDFDNLELISGDGVIQLTLMEMKLLRFLIENEGRTVSRKTILEDVWNLQEDTDTRAIDNFIVRLRKYLEDEPNNPKFVRTVRGVGYKFVAEK